ncbi:MAG TPA: hypothetical protein VIU86_03745, partial [Gaiellaceae bacterium]
MNLLLTSAGITNASIGDALVDLLGKPIADSGGADEDAALRPDLFDQLEGLILHVSQCAMRQ